MRIKIIGENNCARATRHLLRLAGFAVTEYLPADAVSGGPISGYAITIDLAPAIHTPDACLRPDSPTQQSQPSVHGEASRVDRDASSPAFACETATAGLPAFVEDSSWMDGDDEIAGDGKAPGAAGLDESAGAPANFLSDKAGAVASANRIHFDSVESALEAAVLRHVSQLAESPVIVDRPGGVVHSERELRIVAPNSGDARADEAAAVAIEFGILRGLLDLTAPVAGKRPGENLEGKNRFSGDRSEEGSENSWKARARARKWWPFAVLLIAGFGSAGVSPAFFGSARTLDSARPARKATLAGGTPALLFRASAAPHALAGLRIVDAEPAQGQFAIGEGFKITDGTNFLVVDPCAGQAKSFASINQTGNAQLVAGTASKKIYVCSIHVVAAAATDVAMVEGTGSVCATSTAGVSGFGGATAATGWNFAANGGISLGNGDSSLGAEITGGDNLCVFSSGSGQVSGGISYVVE